MTQQDRPLILYFFTRCQGWAEMRNSWTSSAARRSIIIKLGSYLVNAVILRAFLASSTRLSEVIDEGGRHGAQRALRLRVTRRVIAHRRNVVFVAIVVDLHPLVD